MNKHEKEFLDDTIAILIGYDGETTVEGLKGLIDETRERLIKLYKRNVTKEDLGVQVDLDNPFEVVKDSNYEEKRKQSQIIMNKILDSFEKDSPDTLKQTILEQEKEIQYLKSRLIEADADELASTTEINELREDIEILKSKLKKANESRYNLGEGM